MVITYKIKRNKTQTKKQPIVKIICFYDNLIAINGKYLFLFLISQEIYLMFICIET